MLSPLRLAGAAGKLVTAAFFGFLLGVALTVSAQTEKSQERLVTSVLYAIGQLAVDTEKNAAKIVQLTERLDDLEEKIEDLVPARP